MGVDTTSLCSADKCLKRVCRCVTSHSRSATRSHRLLTSSTLRRLVPPLSPLAHEPRGGPIKDPFIFRQLETDCSTNYLIKDPPTKVGKETQIFRNCCAVTLCHML